VVNRWRAFWEDFNSKPNWRYLELPPAQLQKRLDLECGLICRSEMIRAEWMWARRPKSILTEGSFGYALLVLVALLLLIIPHVGILFALMWSIVMFAIIARHTVRAARWRREYEVSITRIMRCNINFK
jgi:hypothetical protein